MVLSRRATVADQAGPSVLVFDGSSDANVRLFFFRFENVAMRGRTNEEKAMEILAYLDGEAFSFYYDTFGREGDLLETAKDYKTVKEALIARFSEAMEPDKLIHEAVSARLSYDDMEGSLREMDLANEKAGFNEQAMFGLLRNAVMEHVELAQFSILRGAVTYDDLKKVIRDFVNGKKAFHSYKALNTKSVADAPRNAARASVCFSDETPRQVLTRPGARATHLESKVDSLADQLLQLTLLVKKNQTATQSRGKVQGRTCSYCKRQGHGASQCDANPHKNTVCPRKRGHSESTCWVKITPEMTRKIDPRIIRSESETERKLMAVAQRQEEEESKGSQVSCSSMGRVVPRKKHQPTTTSDLFLKGVQRGDACQG